MDKKSNKKKVFKMFFRKVKEHTENTEIKVNIDIFYKLFRLIISLDLWMEKPVNFSQGISEMLNNVDSKNARQKKK